MIFSKYVTLILPKNPKRARMKCHVEQVENTQNQERERKKDKSEMMTDNEEKEICNKFGIRNKKA